jgi:hypothetical protein
VLGGTASGLASLLKLVARSRDWYERILAGEVATIGQLAQKCGLTRRYVRNLLQVCKHIATNHRDIGNGQTSAQPDGQRTPAQPTARLGRTETENPWATLNDRISDRSYRYRNSLAQNPNHRAASKPLILFTAISSPPLAHKHMFLGTCPVIHQSGEWNCIGKHKRVSRY